MPNLVLSSQNAQFGQNIELTCCTIIIILLSTNRVKNSLWPNCPFYGLNLPTVAGIILYCSSMSFMLSRFFYIYPIICLKSVDVRTMQFAILAQLRRELSQTYRIHPRYFLSRVRVSIRPRFFLYAKKPQTIVARILRSALRR